MTIKYLGYSSFLLKGKKTQVIIDPFDPKFAGIPFKSTSSDIVLVSHDHAGHNNVKAIKGEPYVVKGPGEYEIGGVMILGFPSYHDKERKEKNTIYRIELGGISICHLGSLGHKLSEEEAEELGNIDILMVPTGGGRALDPRAAAEVVNQIEPAVVIPMHYQDESAKSENIRSLEPVDKFVEAMGAGLSEEENKVKFSPSDFSDLAEGVKLLVMKRA